MKVDELYQDQSLDELAADTRNVTADVSVKAKYALNSVADDDRVLKLAKSAEKKRSWSAATSLISKIEPQLGQYFKNDQPSFNAAREYIYDMIDKGQLSKQLEKIRSEKQAKKQVQPKQDSALAKAYKYAKDFGKDEVHQPVLASMYAEGKKAGGARVWNIQWNMQEGEEERFRPQHIFAKNRAEAMMKFSKRFDQPGLGTVQIESVKEVDWDTLQENGVL